MPSSSESPASAARRIRFGLGGLLALLVVSLFSTTGWRYGAERWWDGEKVKIQVLAQSCWWWAGLAVTVLVLGLLLTSRWWARAWPAVFPGGKNRAPRWLILAVLAIMAAGAALRVPRLGLSLYNDEAHAFRAHLVGEIPGAHLGKPEKFRALSWWSTLYENRAGNNSPPFSVMARTSYSVWRGLTGAPAVRVNETALRLPVLICGVLGIGALAWLGLRLGGPGPALLAACFAAFHPWHMRYSVEARGYGLLLLILPLLFITLDTALRSGRWRHWLALGGLMGGTVMTWLGSAYLIAALYLTLAALACAPSLQNRRAALLMPAVVAGVVAVGLYLICSLPLYLQLGKALQDPGFFKSPHPFPREWFQDVAGFLGFGIPGLGTPPGHSAQPSVAHVMATGWGVIFGLGIAVWLAGLAAGAWRLFRQGGTGLTVPCSFAGGAFLTWAYCSAKGVAFLKWYPIFLLPGLLIVLALGLHGLLKSRAAGWWILALLPLLGSWAPGLIHYTTHGRENLRGAVELARGTAYPGSLANPNNTLYGTIWSESPVYDPTATTLKNAGALQELISQARREARPLFVAHGHTPQAEANSGDVLALLRNPALFRPMATLPGLDEAGATHYLYQLLAEPSSQQQPSPP